MLLHEHWENKVLIFKRANLVFVFNLHPTQSYTDYRFEAPPGEYQVILDCDERKYGGYDRLQPPNQKHITLRNHHGAENSYQLSLYLPAEICFCPSLLTLI